LTSNPYEPLTPQGLQDQTVSTPLNWRAILIAIAICFGVGWIVGGGWAILGMTLVFAAGSSATTYLDSPILMVTGFIVCFIPSVVGAFYLGQKTESRWLAHALVYSFANLFISCLFMLIPFESGITWTDIGYCVLLVPVEIGCVAFAARSC
jgi:ABC-type methionine transport system permease subunit